MDTIQKLRDIHGLLCINTIPDHAQSTVSMHISHFSEVLGRIDTIIHFLEKQVHDQADAIDDEDPGHMDKLDLKTICDVMDGKL